MKRPFARSARSRWRRRSPLVLKGSWTWVKRSACTGLSLAYLGPTWRRPPTWTRGRSAGTRPVNSRPLFTIAAALRIPLTELAGMPAKHAAGPDRVLPRVQHGIEFTQRDDSSGELRITGDDDAALLLWGAAWLDEHRDWIIEVMRFQHPVGRATTGSRRPWSSSSPPPARSRRAPGLEAAPGTVVPRRSPDARVSGQGRWLAGAVVSG